MPDFFDGRLTNELLRVLSNIGSLPRTSRSEGAACPDTIPNLKALWQMSSSSLRTLVEGRSWRYDDMPGGKGAFGVFRRPESGSVCLFDGSGGLLALDLANGELESLPSEALAHCSECRAAHVAADGHSVAWVCMAGNCLHIRTIAGQAIAAVPVRLGDACDEKIQLGPAGSGWFAAGSSGPDDPASDAVAEVRRYDLHGSRTMLWTLHRDDLITPLVVGNRLFVARERLGDGIYLSECEADGSVSDLFRLGESPDSERIQAQWGPAIMFRMGFAAAGGDREALVFWSTPEDEEHRFRLARIAPDEGRLELFGLNEFLMFATTTADGMLVGNIRDFAKPRRALVELVVA